MQTEVCQRWLAGKESYRPSREPLDTNLFTIEAIAKDTPAKAFIEEHHYSGSYPAARYRFGLYSRNALVGVAVFSHPSNQAVLKIFPGEPSESTELGRFVLLDEVPANAESFFLGACFRRLRAEGILGIVSFSDPVARTNQEGEIQFRGHIGTIYQATNAAYLGRATARTLKILPNGSVLSDRTLSKIRTMDRGWRYGANLLEAHGAPPMPEDQPRKWLETWLPKITRPLRHPGNHRYAWILPKSQRKHLPASLPYPKFHA